METQSAIILSATITSLVTIGGWVYNNSRARKHEIDKRKLEYRIETLQSLIHMSGDLMNIQKPINIKKDTTLVKTLESLSLNIQLFGYEEEMDLLHKCTTAINNEDIIKTKEYASQLFLLLVPKIRKELKLPKIIV